MKTNEAELIKEIYNFLLENNFYYLKKNIIEIKKENLELPFEISLKKSNYLKEMINTLIPICFYLYPFGLLNYRAEKEKEKILLLKQKNIFKQKINLMFQKTKDSDVKKILGIFLTSL